MREYKTLRVEMSGAVMTVTISNPPINLQDDAMMEDLSALVARPEADRETKVVVFRSDTPGYFRNCPRGC
jgi:enoyl-CoA hydratase/carnithine racemase